jgi:hypothetical protein
MTALLFWILGIASGVALVVWALIWISDGFNPSSSKRKGRP